MRDDSNDHITYFVIRLPGFIIITPFFRLLALFSVIRVLSIAALPWMVDLSSSRRNVFFCGNSVSMMNSVFCCQLCCSLWILDTILFNVRRSVSFNFCFQPLFFLADDAFLWFVYVVINLETAALDTTWPFWLQILQLNAHQRSVLFENLWSLPFYSTSTRTVTEHNLKFIDTGTTQRKHTWKILSLMFFQCSQHKQFYSYIV